MSISLRADAADAWMASDVASLVAQWAATGLACGVDVVELSSFARVLEVGGPPFVNDVYTAHEQQYCRGRLPQLAARFAAKEAIAKALGTGIRGISWTDMEVVSERTGRPRVLLRGTAAARAEEQDLTHWSLSLSHSESLAIAFVVAESMPRGRVRQKGQHRA
jgi:holo-[acyl-carrier protein] synthase